MARVDPPSDRDDAEGERQMTILITAILLVSLLFVPGLMDIGTYERIRAEAQTAADAAALAATQEISAGAQMGAASGKAGEYARLNGAAVISISGSETSVTVTVEKRAELPFAGSLGIPAPDPQARAKAEVEDVTDADD